MSSQDRPLIFTPDFVQSLTASGAAFERQEIARLAKLPALAEFRRRLEKAIRAYPADKRPVLIQRIRSVEAKELRSAVSELLVYDFLQKEFGEVLVEPELEKCRGKKPHFVLIADRIVVEVATLFEQPNPHVSAIIETINQLRSESKILNLRVLNTAKASTPRLSEIRDGVSEILGSYDRLSTLEPFEFVASDRVIVKGFLYKGSLEHPIVGGVAGEYGFSSDDPDYKAAVRKHVLQAKAHKYRSLVHAGKMKLVLVLGFRDGYRKIGFV